MLFYLHLLKDHISYLRLFEYITVRAFAAAGTAFVISLILGPWVIRWLTSICAIGRDRYQEDIPVLATLHSGKQHTPSMGGVLIILAIIVSTLIWAVFTNVLVWLAMLTLCYMGAIGFADDYIKIVKHDPKGLRVRTKLLLQLLWVVISLVILLNLPQTRGYIQQLMIPFVKTSVVAQMGWLCTSVFVALVIIGASNAVNLTDGLDGLAIGCTGSVVLAFLVMAYVAGHFKFADYLQVPYIPGSGELAVFCGSVLGAALGFLWFNCHPAQVIMGDTGSLALGGAIGMVAVLIKQEFALLFVGGIFVLEALSVILQVGWYKLTKRRIFACAPLHHHFELKKNPWTENQVVVRFWIVSAIFALLGVLMLKIR